MKIFGACMVAECISGDESSNHVAGVSMVKQNKLPRLSRVEFFRFREDELASSLASAIADHVDRFPHAKLTGQHSAISAWSAAAINVPNGGFTQFFYNHQGNHGVRQLASLLNSLA